MEKQVEKNKARSAATESESEGPGFDGGGSMQLKVADTPSMIAQRKVQEAANNSPQVQQLMAMQRAANESLSHKGAVQRQESAVNKTGMPDQLKQGVEQLSGVGMDDVKVHRNSDKPAQLNALAYAQGNDIHLGPGQEEHLPHEAWHVAQQAQGRVKPSKQLKSGAQINDDSGLEKEADVMGAKAMQMKTASTTAQLQTSPNEPTVAIQRVATGLIDGLDPEKPSTYDTGDGHSYKDHGAQTTKEAHITRVKTGVAPSGRKSKVPKDKPSSKFVSDAKHAEAFKTALADLKEKNKPKQKVKGAKNIIDIANAGTMIYENGTEVASSKVQLDIVPVDDTTIRINSMYPSE
jgi:hypothetical protein